LGAQLTRPFAPFNHPHGESMRKKLQNLERLSQKMEARFGENDELVLAFKRELLSMREKLSEEIAAKNLGRRKIDKIDPQATLLH
jgi:CII-binding regulator of phage lambda lysogenization HflD